jgi:iron complex outermembrane receptor protein
MTKTNLLRATSAAALMSVTAAAPAFAQLEEIVVTARKIEENLMTVPIAITAFTNKDIEAIGMKQLTDVMLFTPSFHFVNQQGGSGRNDRTSNALVFRGLFLGNNLAQSAGGLLFIDGAPVINAQPPANTDIARIEVLKGPQSAYFGRSTFAGAINYVTSDPSDKFKGRITAEYSSFNSNEETLSVEGPVLQDKVLVRLSGRHFVRGGYYTNAAETSEKFGGQSTNSVSSNIVIKPSDALKIKGYINYFEDNDGPPAQGAIKQDQFNCNLGGPAGSRASFGYFCGELPTVDRIPPANISGDYTLNAYMQNVLFNPPARWTIFDPRFLQHGGMRRQGFQSDIKISYELANGYSIDSLTAYHRDKYQTILDLNYRDGRSLTNPLSAVIPGVRNDRNFTLVSQVQNRDWSQELRLTSDQKERFRFNAGFNYISYYSRGGTVYGNSEIGSLFAAAVTRTRTSTPAVFGGVNYDITPELTATAEARYQWDKIVQIPVVGANGQYVVGAPAKPLSATFKSFSPRVSLDYKYAPSSTVYALWSRGTRPGGFNSALATVDPLVIAALKAVVPTAGVTYLEEKLDNFEAGVKSTWLDGKARTTLAVYYDKWKNGQVTNNIPVTIPAIGVNNLFGVVVNNGVVDLKGFELEGQIQVTEKLKLSGNMALNDSSVKNYVCGDCNLVYGNFNLPKDPKLPTAPRWMWSLSAEYTDHLAGQYDWYSRVDYSHQGKNFADFSNVAWVGSADKVNLRVGVRDERLTIEAFVLNLTNDKTMLAGLIGIDVFTFLLPPQKNEIRYSLPIPRSWGLRASYNF